MQEETPAKPVAPATKSRNFNWKKLLLWLLMVGLVATGAWFGYQAWDKAQSNIASASQQAADAKSANEAMLADLEDTKNRVNELEVQLLSGIYYDESYEPVYATIDVTNSFAARDWFEEGSTEFLLVLDVNMTNETDEELWFSSYEMKLKGQDDTVYPSLGASPVGYLAQNEGMKLPDGRLELSDVSLQPDERVRGSLVFYVPKAETKFKLYQNNELLEDIQL